MRFRTKEKMTELIPKRFDVSKVQNGSLQRNRVTQRRMTYLFMLSSCYALSIFVPFSSIFDRGLVTSFFYSDPDQYFIKQARRHATTTEFTGEPSHIRLCRHLTPRFEHALAIDNAEKKAEALGLRGLNLANIPELQIPDPIEMDYLIVEEDEHVCLSQSTPTDSLLQMFSSALLSAAASKFKLNVEYDHKCSQWRTKLIDQKETEENTPQSDDNRPFTIQEMLPEDLLENDEGEKIPLEVLAIKNICMGCITEFESNNGTISTRNCALFTRPTVYTPPTLLGKKRRRKRIKRGKYRIETIEDREQPASIKLSEEEYSKMTRELEEKGGPQLPTGIVAILPVLKENLLQVSQAWKEKKIDDLGDAITERIKSRPGSLVEPSINEEGDLNSENEESRAYSSATDDDAVIYITCKKENCSEELFQDSLAMPFYVYVTEIPNSVSSITISVSEDCIQYVQGCFAYGEALSGFLTKFYPRASVELIQDESTFAAFARMTTANYLICPPGLGCMLPALSTAGRSTIVGNPNLIFWLPQLTLETIWNIKFLDMNEVPVMGVTDLDYDSFVNKIPPGKIGQCRQMRGQLGHWVQDMAMAPYMQYPTPIRHYVGEAAMRFQPTDDKPFRIPTTFVWGEDIFPTCEPQMFTKQGFCDAMAEIDMDRIFILGDSSAMNQAQSLWKLLGNEDNPNVLGVRDPNWDRIIECPDEDRSITISYARNDQLIENEEPVDIEKDQRNCYAYCYPWIQRYLEFEGTTLAIVNTGAHYQTHHQFQYALREFVKTFDSLNRVWDVLLYRTSTPGHRDCENEPEIPFESYQDYMTTVTDEYSWDKFIGYNDYAIKLFADREREDLRGYSSGTISASEANGILTEPKRIKIEVLDVYPMTVLRRDGHVSGEECEDCQSHAVHDCMHYFLPGPLDWWNHMMFSHIQDLGRRE